jgi:hypothetical protein
MDRIGALRPWFASPSRPKLASKIPQPVEGFRAFKGEVFAELDAPRPSSTGDCNEID